MNDDEWVRKQKRRLLGAMVLYVGVIIFGCVLAYNGI